MKKVKLYFLSIVVMISLSSCGTASDDGNVTIVSCTDGWTNITNSSDISTADSSQLKFSHDSEGNKKVCSLTGSATVVN